jgi:energy-converting hydrogenase Eha subunit A
VGFFILESGELFFTSIVMMTLVMFSVAASILVEFQSIIVAPEDYHILAHRPISSRTFFASRISNMLVYLSVITGSMGLVPSLIYMFRDGFQPHIGIAAMLGMLGAAMFTSMGIIFVYVNLMRFVHPKKLNRIFSYLQLVLSFIVYGSGMIFSSLFTSGVLNDVHLVHERWMLLLPPAWFSSVITIFSSSHTWLDFASILMGSAAILALFLYAYQKLSLEYAAMIARLDESSEERRSTRPSRAMSLPMFTRNEGRAAARLIRNQFKYDQKFRMSVLAIIPLTILYLIAGLSGGGGLADPFVDPAEHVEKANLLYFALAFFPVLLMASLVRSDSWQASWIFHATPCDKGRIVLAVKDVLVVFFIIPYVFGLGVVFSFHFESIEHVLLHVFILSMLSHLILQVIVMINPYLPFSRPTRKGERTAGIFIGIIIAAIVMTVIINVLARLIYPSAYATGITLLLLAMLTLVFERLAAERVRKKTRLLQFDQ